MRSSIKRETGNFAKKEQLRIFEALIEELFGSGQQIYMGYSDDPRNTDNAWMESKVVHFHCTHVLGALLPLMAAKNTRRVEAGPSLLP